MLRDEIIEMARKAGVSIRGHYDETGSTPTELEAFAKLVAAKEREACAAMCDSVYHQNIGPEFGEVRYGIASCAQAIRARGEA